ncbi:MAG: hypothetical protein HW380_671 [Magnetococcales bacterium]|nr:hypothetical protein [Magnetococcales bacterium]
MSRPSTIKRLPPEIKTEIHRLLEHGTPIHEIHACLQQLGVSPPSKSAIGRYKQDFDQQMRRLRLSREMAATWAKSFQDEPEGNAAKLTTELLENLAMHVSRQALEDGQELKVKEIATLAGAVRDLSQARRSMVDTAEKIRAQTLKETGEKMEKIIQSQGLSIDVATAIREAMTKS